MKPLCLCIAILPVDGLGVFAFIAIDHFVYLGTFHLAVQRTDQWNAGSAHFISAYEWVFSSEVVSDKNCSTIVKVDNRPEAKMVNKLITNKLTISVPSWFLRKLCEKGNNSDFAWWFNTWKMNQKRQNSPNIHTRLVATWFIWFHQYRYSPFPIY